jgi:hypothetical protein
MLLGVHAIRGSASARAHRSRITHERVAVEQLDLQLVASRRCLRTKRIETVGTGGQAPLKVPVDNVSKTGSKLANTGPLRSTPAATAWRCETWRT